MDTRAVAGVDSVIYTTSDIGMANTLRDTSRTGMEVTEFNGVYQIECTTPEQIASFFFLAGADIKASEKAAASKYMGDGRVVYDMGGTNAGAAVVQFNYPVCYTPNIGQAVGNCWYFIPNTPENRQLFANEWLDSDGDMDRDMIGETNNGDGSPVYTTPDTWYGTFQIDGKEYFPAGNLPDMDQIDLNKGGDVELTLIQGDNHSSAGDWDAVCYKTVSPEYNIPVVCASDFFDTGIEDLAIVILKAMGRIS